MTWSMASVSYRMAGAGNWQSVLPDEQARRLYSHLYPAAQLDSVDERFETTIASWQEAGIATVTGRRLLLLGPLMTDADLNVLGPWFDRTSDSMSQAIREYLPDYRALAESLGGATSAPRRKVDNLMTILVCAQALDMETFRVLRGELMGRYPSRGPAGRFFFWGYAFSGGPRRIFGVTTYGRGQTVRASVLRSRGLKRGALPTLLRLGPALAVLTELCKSSPAGKTITPGERQEMVRRLRNAALLEPDGPPRTAVPVLGDRDLARAARLNGRVSRGIASAFTAELAGLYDIIPQCSFAACSLPDILCMVFHLAYSYCADALVEAGMIPGFPQEAGGEWGVWIHHAGECTRRWSTHLGGIMGDPAPIYFLGE